MFCHKSNSHKPMQCLTQPEVHKQLQIGPELKVTCWPLNRTTLLDCKRSCRVSIYSISGNVNMPESMKMSWLCLGPIVVWCWVSCLTHVVKKKKKKWRQKDNIITSYLFPDSVLLSLKPEWIQIITTEYALNIPHVILKHCSIQMYK